LAPDWARQIQWNPENVTLNYKLKIFIKRKKNDYRKLGGSIGNKKILTASITILVKSLKIKSNVNRNHEEPKKFLKT